jgi:hypothetical protein
VPAVCLTAAAGGGGHVFQTMICFGAVIVQPALDLTFYGGAQPGNRCEDQDVFLRQRSLQNGFVMRDAVAQKANLVEHPMDILPQ